MVTKINSLISEMHLKVLGLFTNGYFKNYYIREISKNLGISSKTSREILSDLEKKNVLTSEIRGKIKTYYVNINRISKEYFVLAEEYKFLTFLNKKPLIGEVIDKMFPFIEGIGVIFGSYVKDKEKEGSDLDIFIVGDCNRSKIKEISRIYGIDISIKKYSLEEFLKNIERDILINEVINDHIIIKGTKEFVERCLNEKN